MKKFLWIVLLCSLLLPTGVASACPMCKDSIPNSDAQEAGSLPGGFNMSVYYMLSGLFVTIGLVTGVITKGVKSTNAAMEHRDDTKQ
jgi:hypothetical protein